MRAKTIARHARPVGKSPRTAWVRAELPRARDYDTPMPAVPPGRLRADPLTGPIDITERPVLGDQIRRPIAICEIGCCAAWYADPAALGEADIRARALGAGWRHDDVGRLLCPACQQRTVTPAAAMPVVRWHR